MGDQTIKDLETRKKRSLKRYRKNKACIARLEAKLAILTERLSTIKSPSYSGMPRGGKPTTIDDLVSDKIDLEDRIDRLKAKNRKLKRAICEEIDSLEDPRLCEVLEAYFIDCLDMDEIAEEMGYTERRVYKLYSEAISILSVLGQ